MAEETSAEEQSEGKEFQFSLRRYFEDMYYYDYMILLYIYLLYSCFVKFHESCCSLT